MADDSNRDSLPSFYVYTGVGVQSVVFKRLWEEVSPAMLDEADSGNVSRHSDHEANSRKKGEQLASQEADDMIRKIDEEVKLEGQNDVAIFNKQVKEKMLTEIEGESSNRSGGDQNDYLNDPAVSIPGIKPKKENQPAGSGSKKQKDKEVGEELRDNCCVGPAIVDL